MGNTPSTGPFSGGGGVIGTVAHADSCVIVGAVEHTPDQLADIEFLVLLVRWASHRALAPYVLYMAVQDLCS